MAEQPKAHGAVRLAGAIVSGALGAGFVVIGVLLAIVWTSRHMTPADGFLFWWVAPLLALLGVAVIAVAVSFAREWGRLRPQ